MGKILTNCDSVAPFKKHPLPQILLAETILRLPLQQRVASSEHVPAKHRCKQKSVSNNFEKFYQNLVIIDFSAIT
jgi:hypothetical protein